MQGLPETLQVVEAAAHFPPLQLPPQHDAEVVHAAPSAMHSEAEHVPPSQRSEQQSVATEQLFPAEMHVFPGMPPGETPVGASLPPPSSSVPSPLAPSSAVPASQVGSVGSHGAPGSVSELPEQAAIATTAIEQAVSAESEERKVERTVGAPACKAETGTTWERARAFLGNLAGKGDVCAPHFLRDARRIASTARGAGRVSSRCRWRFPPRCSTAAAHPMHVESLLPEHALRSAVFFLVRLVEAAGALVIFSGAAVGFFRFAFRAITRRNAGEFTPVRLDVGRMLALGLEFQLASDLLRTAVAPSFAEIGKLAAVAAIRTALNFFLGREIKEERAELARNEEHLR